MITKVGHHDDEKILTAVLKHDENNTPKQGGQSSAAPPVAAPSALPAAPVAPSSIYTADTESESDSEFWIHLI